MAQVEKIRQAVILAGGQGTRLRPLTNDRPKPMVLINGRPFLEYLIELLRVQGIEEVVLLLGYLPEKIIEHFGDGSRFGLTIRYSVAPVEAETGTRLRQARELLDETFLLMYCDNYWPLNLELLQQFHQRQGVIGTVAVYANRDGITKNNILIDERGYVICYDKDRLGSDLNGVEIGFFIFDQRVFDFMPETDFSFERIVLPALIEQGQLAGYLTNDRYYSLGSIGRLPLTEAFLRSLTE